MVATCLLALIRACELACAAQDAWLGPPGSFFFRFVHAHLFEVEPARQASQARRTIRVFEASSAP